MKHTRTRMRFELDSLASHIAAGIIIVAIYCIIVGLLFANYAEMGYK